MALQKVDTLIFSDVHLGSRVCRAKALLAMLDTFEFNRLIINGDLHDDRTRRLPPSHRDVLEHIQDFSRKGCEVVYIDGNHDPDLGTEKSYYLWEYNGERYLAIHGHQFDKVHNAHPWLANFGDIVYRCAQVLLTHEINLARNIKKRSKMWIAAGEVIAAGASAFAHSLAVQHVFCGHTHRAHTKSFSDIGISYYNSGCWTDIPSTCITVGEQGIQIHEYL